MPELPEQEKNGNDFPQKFPNVYAISLRKTKLRQKITWQRKDKITAIRLFADIRSC